MSDTRNLQGAFQRRDDTRRRAEANQASASRMEYRITTIGPGRVRPRRCDFSCAFLKEPSISVSHALIDGDAIIGAQPTANATVRNWHRGSTGLYIGADIVVTVTGHRRQRLSVRIVFTERALTFPIGSTLSSSSTADDTI